VVLLDYEKQTYTERAAASSARGGPSGSLGQWPGISLPLFITTNLSFFTCSK
jgi:hypothetical protein